MDLLQIPYFFIYNIFIYMYVCIYNFHICLRPHPYPPQVMEQVRPAFKMGFGEVAKVGSCVLLALRRDAHLVLVNCGDCRAVLGSSLGVGGAGTIK
jgi:hypothetical protein